MQWGSLFVGMPSFYKSIFSDSCTVTDFASFCYKNRFGSLLDVFIVNARRFNLSLLIDRLFIYPERIVSTMTENSINGSQPAKLEEKNSSQATAIKFIG